MNRTSVSGIKGWSFVGGSLPIKQSLKAKSTSWRVAVEWREASTKDAGWREDGIEERRRSSGRLRDGNFGGMRHGLIFGRQRDARQDLCCDSGRPPWVAESVGSAKVIRSPS